MKLRNKTTEIWNVMVPPENNVKRRESNAKVERNQRKP